MKEELRQWGQHSEEQVEKGDLCSLCGYLDVGFLGCEA